MVRVMPWALFMTPVIGVIVIVEITLSATHSRAPCPADNSDKGDSSMRPPDGFLLIIRSAGPLIICPLLIASIEVKLLSFTLTKTANVLLCKRRIIKINEIALHPLCQVI